MASLHPQDKESREQQHSNNHCFYAN